MKKPTEGLKPMFTPLCGWISGAMVCSALPQAVYLPGYGSYTYYSSSFTEQTIIPVPSISLTTKGLDN